jgi:hypothetical protein
MSQIQITLLALSLPNLLRLPILNSLARHSEPLNSRRHTTVTSCLQNHLPDLFLSTAVIQRTFNMRRKLSPAILTTQHCDVEERASLELEARSCPDGAPA